MSLQKYLEELSSEYEYCQMEHLYIELAKDASLHGNYSYMLELLSALNIDSEIYKYIPKRKFGLK